MAGRAEVEVEAVGRVQPVGDDVGAAELEAGDRQVAALAERRAGPGHRCGQEIGQHDVVGRDRRAVRPTAPGVSVNCGRAEALAQAVANAIDNRRALQPSGTDQTLVSHGRLLTSQANGRCKRTCANRQKLSAGAQDDQPETLQGGCICAGASDVPGLASALHRDDGRRQARYRPDARPPALGLTEQCPNQTATSTGPRPDRNRRAHPADRRRRHDRRSSCSSRLATPASRSTGCATAMLPNARWRIDPMTWSLLDLGLPGRRRHGGPASLRAASAACRCGRLGARRRRRPHRRPQRRRRRLRSNPSISTS